MAKDIRFNVEIGEFRKKVNFVRTGLGSSKTDLAVILIGMNVIGKKCIMFAANKEMFARCEMKIQRDDDAKDGSFALSGQRLAALAARAEAERLTFSVDDENMEVQAGFLKVNFVLSDGSILKQVLNGVSDHLEAEGVAINRPAFEEALVCAKSCTTSNSIRPDVTHVELRKGRMLSSDGRKIMVYTHSNFDESISFKVPAGILASVITAVKNIDAASATVAEGKNYYYVKANLNEYSVGVRKVERDFPAIEGQIANAAAPSDEISIDKKVFTTVLEGVSLGLDSDEVRVTIEADGKNPDSYLEVSAKNSLGRRSAERAQCGRTGSSMTSFPVSFKHILDTLGVFKGDSVVDIYVMSEKNMMLVKDKTSDREVDTLIPFRTDEQIDREKKEKAEAEAARKSQTEVTETDTSEEGAEAAAGAVHEDDVDLS